MSRVSCRRDQTVLRLQKADKAEGSKSCVEGSERYSNQSHHDHKPSL